MGEFMLELAGLGGGEPAAEDAVLDAAAVAFHEFGAAAEPAWVADVVADQVPRVGGAGQGSALARGWVA